MNSKIGKTNKKIRHKKSTKKYSPKSYFKSKIYDDISLLIKTKNKKRKIKSDDFEIPNYNNYELIISNNYNVSQLKKIAKHYKQKISGNKPELLYRLYNFLKYSMFAIKIQSIFRSHVIWKFNKLKGVGLYNKKLCVNDTDFLTMENLEDIPYEQFYSFKDKDNFVYGFDICSLYNMFVHCKKNKGNRLIKNPYNRKDINPSVYNNIKEIIKMSKCFNKKINVSIKDDEDSISEEKKIEHECISLFQKMDEMGFITNTKWFFDCDQRKLMRLIRELRDIWEYRAQISNEIKRNIFPHGNPFSGYNRAILRTKPLTVVQKAVLNVIKKFINYSVNNEAKSLGTFYVLGSFTLVNTEAATTMPWLYESFYTNNIANN